MVLNILLLITAAILLYLYIRYKLNYWQRKGVQTLTSSSFKSTKEFAFQQNSFADRSLNFYKEFKARGLKHAGLYFLLRPFYVAVDVGIIKSIIQNDFHHFVDRGLYVNEEGDPLSGHLFGLRGKRWKIMRAKLTPTFTSGKMKMMFETVVQCTNGLTNVMDNEIGNTVDIKDILGRFTTDVIGNVAFGLDCNSLENPHSEFRIKGTAFFQRSLLRNLKSIFLINFPKFMKKLNAKGIPKDVNDFFMGIVKETVAYREKNNITRKDFLQLLIELKNRGKLIDDEKLEEEHITDEENKMTIEALAAQAFVFFEAGFETSSTTMTFCLYELAKNKHLQDKVREHIRHVLAKHNGKLTYEAMTDMHYLEQAINETLRKYPPVPGLNRVCTKEYLVPETDVIIEKGTRILIPVMGVHYDPEYYPDPQKFDPDRFTEENKHTRPAFTFLPFGDGPRVCIGQRFGMMQAKVGLVALLLNYEFSIDKKTQEPLQFHPKSFVLSTKSGIWLNPKKLSSSKKIILA